MKKYILIGTILLSMLLFAACGEEKPLADRVIENLEDCMGAREVTEEEYEEIKRKTLIDPVDYFHSLRTENAYLICKESDLTKVNISLSFDTDEDLETEYALLYKYENEVDNRNSYIKVSLYEFVNDDDKTSKSSAFEHALESLGIKLRRTRPYSPWQNGKVERSHREDGKILYNRRVFTSEKELIEQVEKHQRRYNKTAKTVLNFKSPNQVVAEFFQKCKICVDN